jgi:hypothetical protein
MSNDNKEKLTDIKERLNKLKSAIEKYRYEYHVLDKSSISESALDSLKHELVEIETQYPQLITPDSPSQRVAGKPLPEFKKIEHKVAQWSFNDAFSPEEIALYGEALCQIAKKNPQAIDGIIEVKNDFIKTLEDVLYWGEEFINLGRLMGDYNLFYYKLVQEDIKNLISGFSKDDFIKYWPHIKEIAKTEHLGTAS